MSQQAPQTDKSQQDTWKREAAKAAVAQLQSGMIVGLGSGSTAQLAVDAIGERVKSGLQIIGVSTSEKTQEQARQLGIPTATLAEYPQLDITLDGADEVETHGLSLIKGGGGNLLREKIVAVSSKRLVIVVDGTKIVDKLGAHPLPVEVVPFGWQTTERRLRDLGGNPVMRRDEKGSEYITDGGHYILDCSFGLIDSPGTLARQLDDVVGVVEHGLFLGLAWQVTVAGAAGVRVLSNPA